MATLTRAERERQEKQELEEKFESLPPEVKEAMKTVEALVANPDKLARLQSESDALEAEMKILQGKRDELSKRKDTVDEVIGKLQSAGESIVEFKKTLVGAM